MCVEEECDCEEQQHQCYSAITPLFHVNTVSPPESILQQQKNSNNIRSGLHETWKYIMRKIFDALLHLFFFLNNSRRSYSLQNSFFFVGCKIVSINMINFKFATLEAKNYRQKSNF